MADKTTGIEAIRRRLVFLCEKHGQAEVARRTGTSRQNINRYLRGRKAPIDFAAACVTGLEVNPAWLLVGEGTPYLSDVTASTSDAASSVLAVVRAMGAAARARLGSLVGKDHTQVLVELNENLESYEKLRAKLHDQTRPLFIQLVRDMANAVNQGRLVEARELQRAAMQVSRLCPDEHVLVKFDHIQVALEHRLGNVQRSLELQRSVFVRQMVLGGNNPRWLDEAYNYVIVLYQMRMFHEARRICHAAIALMHGNPAAAVMVQRLLTIAGDLDIELGNMKRGASRLHVAHAALDHAQHPYVRGHLAQMLLLSGAQELKAFVRQPTTSVTWSANVLLFACWFEDATLLGQACRACAGGEGHRLPNEILLARHAVRLLGLLKSPPHQRARLLETMKPSKEQAATSKTDAFAESAFWAQLVRIADGAHAAQAILTADETLHRLPSDITPRLLVRAIHFRNILESDQTVAYDSAIVTRAREFFGQHHQRGYGCFQAYANNKTQGRP